MAAISRYHVLRAQEEVLLQTKASILFHLYYYYFIVSYKKAKAAATN
jgi:hypothetical protein